MKKILILFAHPAVRHSTVNISMAETAQGIENVTFVDLYAENPRFRIDVPLQQQRLLEHDIIVMQFPLMWYSTPSLLKEWQDLVLEYGFAYGENGTRLSGKQLLPVASIGSHEPAYQPDGHNRVTIDTLLWPLRATAKLTSMSCLSPYVIFGSLAAREEKRLEPHVDGYRKLLFGLAGETLSLPTIDEQPYMQAADIEAL